MAGRRLRTARNAAGLTLAQMAELVSYSEPYLSQIENGHKPTPIGLVKRYEDALGAKIGSEPLAVGVTDVELISQGTDVLTALGLRHGGQAVAEIAKAQWSMAEELLNRNMGDPVRKSLSGAAGRLAGRLAWSWSDAGRSDKASALYQDAVGLAGDAGDVDLRGALLADVASLMIKAGNPAGALRVLSKARPAAIVVKFSLYAARARAWGSLGDWERCIRAIGVADEAHAGVNLADVPEFIRPYVSGHEAHAHREAGEALHSLARAGQKKAVSLATQRLGAAVELFGPERAHAVERCRTHLDELTG